MNGLQKKILVKALDNAEDLTEWEYEFVNSLIGRGDNYELTEKQNSILNRIWGKIDG